MEDYRELAKDTRNPYGAEAKYQVAQSLYDAKEYPFQQVGGALRWLLFLSAFCS